MRPPLAIAVLLLAGCSHGPTKAQRIRAEYPLGYHSTCTDTGSALPVFRGGDVVWVNTVVRYQDLRPGMWVIAAPHEDAIPIGPHVIVWREGPLFRTQGINNRWPDEWVLSPSNYVGVVEYGHRGGVLIAVPHAFTVEAVAYAKDRAIRLDLEPEENPTRDGMLLRLAALLFLCGIGCLWLIA